MIDLFPRNEVVGVFRGFRDGHLEFHADLALPYQTKFQNIPMHGQFLLVQLESPNEAVLGRITSLASEGRLSGQAGEDYNIRAIRDERQVPEQLRQEYLKYRVRIRVLGVVRSDEDDGVLFVPSHRRLPHVGSPVAFLSTEVLRALAGHDATGAALGVLALGEYIYAGDERDVAVQDWMQVLSPVVRVNFPVEHLVARRTFVFARAGFGKSNLNKLLFSRLYATQPTVRKRSGDVPVGTVIFDPEGEYFWPDDKGRPGLCDVPELSERIVVFTSREAPSEFYGSYVAGGIKLDIRRLRPADVISIALAPEKQDQQNVRKLRGMNPADWAALVDLVDDHGNSADIEMVNRLLHLERDQQAEALAARANMTSIVRMLHDRQSQLMDMLLQSLADGKLCIVDVSQLRGGPSLVLSGLILRRIFDRNQDEFTKADAKTIPTIAVVEEAQSVLNEKASAAGPYIEWVKEGRKYDLGAMLITQQPGSISSEILSQGDNWFIFHLLSAADLQSVRNANAHFSEDLLSALLNEPIPGQGLFWSSVGGSPFPIPLRVLSFEAMYRRLDQDYSRGPVKTYASWLREKFRASTAPIIEGRGQEGRDERDEAEQGEVDAFRLHQQRAIEALRDEPKFWESLDAGGIPWGVVVRILQESLPESMDDRGTVAYSLVRRAVSEVLGGEQDQAWKTERRGTRNTLFIVRA